jgi:hypothetical protein
MRLSPVLVDVVSILVVGVLAGLGKLSAELASGTILAILAGRMKPVNGSDGGTEEKSGGDKSAPPTTKRSDSMHFEGDEPPSGFLTILTAPLLALKSAAHQH